MLKNVPIYCKLAILAYLCAIDSNFDLKIESNNCMIQKVLKVFLLALLYVLAFFIVEVSGWFHPYAWTYAAVPAAVIAAWPYFKLCQRYPIPGMAMLCAVMLLLLNFILGQGHEFLALGCFIFGFLAEGLRKLFGNCRGRWGVISSYAVMSLIPFSKTCVLWIDYDTVLDMDINNMRDIYYASMGRMLSWSMLGTMIVITLVLAVLTMWLLTLNWRPRDKYEVFHS